MQVIGAVIVLVLVTLGARGQKVQDCEVTDWVAVCETSLPEDETVTKLKLGNVEKILSQDLAKYKDLQTIDLSNSGLHHIDHDAFISNEKLIELNLSGNILHIPEKGSFFVSKSLTHLNLSHTNFKNVSESIFSDLPNLQEIDLSATGFKKFSLVSKLEQLKTLIISEDTAINKSLICHDSHLQQIIELNKLTYNCSKTKEEKITAIAVDDVKPETENEENPEISTEVNNATTEKSAPPENLEAPKTDSDIPPETPVNQTLPTEDNKKPQTENTEIQPSPETDTEKTAEAEKPTEKPVDAEKTAEDEKPAESENPAEKPAETEEKSTEKSTKNEENDGALDSLMQFPEISRKEQRTTEKTHDEMNAEQQETINIEEVKDQAQPNESSGTNIVLGIILCVMVVGALGFGFKYWKGRRQGYRNANTEDVEEGKELQNMVASNHKEEDQN